MQFNSPEKLKNKTSGRFLRDLGLDVATSATGIGFGSETDVTWKTGGMIRCNNAFPDWIIDLYCEGSQEKERERVRDEDGSWSVETEKINHFYWDHNANGSIIEKKDTIGDFLIIMNPRQDSLLKRWADYVFSQPETKLKSESKNTMNNFFASSYFIDYGIIGIFRGRNFSLISNGSALKTWIFSDDKLLCVFMSDPDDNPFINRKDRIMPSILINKNNSETDRYDLIRLAMMSRILGKTLK